MKNRHILILFALLLMIGELSYINAKSLIYLTSGSAQIDHIFSIIGSIAFSTVTVLIMSSEAKKWAKIAFPVFDTLLVFCGLNLKYYESIINGTDNEVRFLLTIFMALFTGLITYSLGLINYKEQSEGTGRKDKDRINSLESEKNSLLNDIDKYKSDYEKLVTEYKKFSTEFLKAESENKEHQRQIKELKSDLDKYKTEYFKAERSRILKKKEENRTPEEKELLTVTER